MRTNYHLLFSYWLLVWFVLYISGYIDYNPTLILLIIQMIAIIFLYIKHFYYKKTTSAYLFTRMFIMKFLPLYFLWYTNKLRIKMKDVYFTIGIFLIYILHLHLFNTNVIEIYTKTSIYRINNG